MSSGKPLPVIVGMGGISPAGRSSAHHGYRWLVADALSAEKNERTVKALLSLMGEGAGELSDDREALRAATLIRKIMPELFDVDALPLKLPAQIVGGDDIQIEMESRLLPEYIPGTWDVSPSHNNRVKVKLRHGADLALNARSACEVSSAGQLPAGFRPGDFYPSRHHPRGLEMAVFAINDALNSIGIDWEHLRANVPPEAVSVYAGSAMSQLDPLGFGGMIQARLKGKRSSPRQCPFGFAEMVADFINAYVIGSMGNTGASVGACASFLYNLRLAIYDISTGRSRIAIVGSSEAPVIPEIIEGYAALGALATDRELCRLDGLADDAVPDYRRACRPFADNCGFTIGESSQFIVLFDDRLAVECGANMLGAVADVFVNADGFKKSISAPGAGNYLTMARAAGCVKELLGSQSLCERSFVMAHGTGTPQNRVTESEVLSRVASWFGIEDWPISAVKCYLGHSIGSAGGDQIMAALGVWQEGWIPGIKTMQQPAEDVEQKGLWFSSEHIETAPDGTDCALINSKGFGGNNATAVLLSPHKTEAMCQNRYGDKLMRQWQKVRERTLRQADAYDTLAVAGKPRIKYIFDQQRVLKDTDLEVKDGRIYQKKGQTPATELGWENHYSDMFNHSD